MAEPSYTKRKIEEEEDKQNNEQSKTSFASKFQKTLSNSHIDDMLELLNAVLSFMLAITFSIETYYQSVELSILQVVQTPIWIEFVEIVLMVFMIADFLLFFFLHHEDRILYTFSFDSFLTYLTLIPTALIRFSVVTDINVIQEYYLNFWRVLRLFSVFRLSKVFTRRNMTIPRVYFKLIFTIFVIIFVFASAMLTLENNAILLRVQEEIENRIDPTYEPDMDSYENVAYY